MGNRCAVVVEDDPDIRLLLSQTLSMAGFDVHEVGSGEAAIARVQDVRPDLIALDLGLPDVDGIEVCRRLRQMTDAYILMITARAEEIDKVMGLEIGADDYINKPFSPREVQARVAAMFRRPRSNTAVRGDGVASPERNRRASDRVTPSDAAVLAATPAVPQARDLADESLLRHGGLEVDPDARLAHLHGEELPLTRLEFDLLVTMLSRPRRVWSREALLRSVWGSEWTSDHHLVEVHVANLRRKLGDDARAPRWITTVRGVGYRLVPAA